MESNWAYNGFVYGLMNYFPLGGWQFSTGRPLYALLDDGNYVITNATKLAPDKKCLGFQVLSPERVSFFPSEINIGLFETRFPYGLAVEPDEPP